MPRLQPSLQPVSLRFHDFELDEANARLLKAGEALSLAPTPFNLLCALARQPGRLLTKDALLDEVWGHQFVSESVLKTAVSDLRCVLGDSPKEPRIIETVPRRGYRFIAEAISFERAAAAVAAIPPAAPTPPAAEEEAFFVGRANALARLDRSWARAREGRRAMVWVAGEPGIGKTTLVEHFLQRLPGLAVARGQCVEHYGTGEPYLPVLEALADLCRQDPALPPLLKAVAPTWMLQLPWQGTPEEREGVRRDLAGAGPDRMLREMGELLDRYTEHRPLLLLTEDLHWSDRATLQLIDHVARRRGRSRLMWLATFRVAEAVALDHPLNPVRRELRLHRLIEEISLDPFSETEVASLLACRSPGLASDESLVRALHEKTDGVPLFLASVIDEVTEGAVAPEEARARLSAVDVPDTIAAIIDHSIARLDDEQRVLLAAAAVCGVEFRVETLAEVLGRDLTSTALACDRLVREHVWLKLRAAGEVDGVVERAHAFRHALFRQVLYERTPPAARVRLHAAAGAALESERAQGRNVAASELAMHFHRGRQAMAALRHYAEAAEAALRNFAPADCVALSARALALIPEAPVGSERDALELTLATLTGLASFQAVGVGAQARDAFQRAYGLLQSTPDHPIRVRLLHGLGYLFSLRGEYVEALVVAKRAEALATESADDELMLAACCLHGEVHHLQGRTLASRTWAQRGLEIAESLGSSAGDVFAADPRVNLMGMLAIDLSRAGHVRQSRELVRRANARAAELRHPMTRLSAAWHEALLQVRLDDAVRVSELADEMQALVDEFSLAHGRTAAQWFRGWALARQGHAREGAALIREACEQNIRLGMRAGASEVLGYAAEALLRAGETQAARESLDEALRIVEETGERMYLSQLLRLSAAIAGRDGDGQRALAALRRSADEARAQHSPSLEMAALHELCSQPGATDDDRQGLSALQESISEASKAELAQAGQGSAA